MSDSDPFRGVQWQPITELSAIVALADGENAFVDEQTIVFQDALRTPHLLDDETINHARDIFTRSAQFIDIYDEQFRRWRTMVPTPAQLSEINRMTALIAKLREKHRKFFALLDQFKGKTIDGILAKSDFELGLEALQRLNRTNERRRN